MATPTDRPPTPEQLLAATPQQGMFRMVHEVLDATPEAASGRFTFPGPEHFGGHFPGRPVVPGTFLVESAAQCSVLPLATCNGFAAVGPSFLDDWLFFLTDAQVDVERSVSPGDTLVYKARRAYYRRHRCRAEFVGLRGDERVVHGTIGVMGARRDS